jgi:uncharacterized BrkB/YihY/UPF0761 family membrane protein
MQHIKALVLKTIATLALTFVILGLFFNYSFVNVLTLTILIGIISYVLGDLLLLPRTNNFTATISDFALAMLLTWFYLSNITVNENNVFIASVLTAIGIALFENFFHKYMVTNVLRDKEPNQKVNNLRYQTEASEELTPDKNEYKRDNT